ncbi:MAG: hypothetical protein HY000_41210 [Planctomycetes bacterium]|nr:hypothetical protein [Planctomycetota bacterium]
MIHRDQDANSNPQASIPNSNVRKLYRGLPATAPYVNAAISVPTPISEVMTPPIMMIGLGSAGLGSAA